MKLKAEKCEKMRFRAFSDYQDFQERNKNHGTFYDKFFTSKKLLSQNFMDKFQPRVMQEYEFDHREMTKMIALSWHFGSIRIKTEGKMDKLSSP